jgi:hypothetical protein
VTATAIAMLRCGSGRRRQREYEYRRQYAFSRDGLNQWPHLWPLSNLE